MNSIGSNPDFYRGGLDNGCEHAAGLPGNLHDYKT